MEPREIISATTAIGSIGAAFYFVPETIAVGEEHGLGGFRFYLLGRGGVLGNCDASVVQSAFGYFESGLVRNLWESAQEKMGPREAGSLYLSCAHDMGRRYFSDIDPTVLASFNLAAAKVIAQPEGASLPLFVAHRAEEAPDSTDPAALAMHNAVVLRELRGSVHLLALTAVGLDSNKAHAIHRPNDVELFGWEAPLEFTDAERLTWQEAEDLTNDLLVPAYAVLSDDEAAAFVAGVDAMTEALKPLAT